MTTLPHSPQQEPPLSWPQGKGNSSPCHINKTTAVPYAPKPNSTPHHQQEMKVLKAQHLKTTKNTQFYTNQPKGSVLLLLFVFPNPFNCFCSDTPPKLAEAMLPVPPHTPSLYSAGRASDPGGKAKPNACLT